MFLFCSVRRVSRACCVYFVFLFRSFLARAPSQRRTEGTVRFAPRLPDPRLVSAAPPGCCEGSDEGAAHHGDLPGATRTIPGECAQRPLSVGEFSHGCPPGGPRSSCPLSLAVGRRTALSQNVLCQPVGALQVDRDEDAVAVLRAELKLILHLEVGVERLGLSRKNGQGRVTETISLHPHSRTSPSPSKHSTISGFWRYISISLLALTSTFVGSDRLKSNNLSVCRRVQRL
ncbi:hypothetical protein BaRGS_00015443 [Batillaria attramentaria]|uniref:Secreted protein n=1 Tax=Batillaria attramentaria TaxID=370345 RepID=A0ABD0L2N6_9CAEN